MFKLANCLFTIVCLCYFKTATCDVSEVLAEFDKMLQENVDESSLFDKLGSLDVGVYKRDKESQEIVPLYVKTFGKSQVQRVKDKVIKIKDRAPLDDLKNVADEYFPAKPNVNNMNKSNLYRIASNTKTFIGTAANLFVSMYGLNLDEKIHPKYLNLSTLGAAHNWNQPTVLDEYSTKMFPNSQKYIESITFRHLLTHTSGLSRESLKDSVYSYGSSRTSTPRCPPNDIYQGVLACDNTQDVNWRPWTQHIISYMMPACGYKKYPQKSLSQTTCLPGEYFHYSNAGYSILGLALDNYLKTVNNTYTLESWISENIINYLHMNDTVFTWVDFNTEQKGRTAHGCYGGNSFETCNQSRALTDYSDRGIKTPPGGIWSSVYDLANYLLKIHDLPNITRLLHGDPKFSPAVDRESEEDHVQMPATIFNYGHGWYIAEQFSCMQNKKSVRLNGAWGSVPGFTSYMITNTKSNNTHAQYAVVMLRSYNYAERFNLGNQARKLLWRLLYPDISLNQMRCPVVVKDDFSNGDFIIGEKVPNSSEIIEKNTFLLALLVMFLLSFLLN